jgi:predicted transglutaminase-like cysteine proteinase
LITALALALGVSTTALAFPETTMPAPVTGPAKSLAGWVDFCQRHAEECVVNPDEPIRISLTPEILHTIARINRRVNRQIKPITDLEHWGVVDRWDFPDDGSGDCEDYQLLKRKLLAERGLPRRALRMTVVIDEIGEGHAVLMVRTDRGDLVLDNKTNAILPWQDTGYRLVKREGDLPGQWVSLEQHEPSTVALTSRP